MTWHLWRSGDVEAVDVLTVKDGRAFVAWPESVRTVDSARLFPPRDAGPVRVHRPESWVSLDSLRDQCSDNVGGDPAGGCDELVPFGADVCDAHALAAVAL